MTEILKAEIELAKETSGTYQYKSSGRPEGIRVLMLDRWLFEGKSPQKLRITIEVVDEE